MLSLKSTEEENHEKTCSAYAQRISWLLAWQHVLYRLKRHRGRSPLKYSRGHSPLKYSRGPRCHKPPQRITGMIKPGEKIGTMTLERGAPTLSYPVPVAILRKYT